MTSSTISASSRRDLPDWKPEDPKAWQSKVAWTTLWVTTFNLMLGFMSWYLVSALAPRLGNIGFVLSEGQLYWLTAMPGLSGGFLRLLWMFLPPLMGTRRMVTYSMMLMLLPVAGWAWVVTNPTAPYWMLLFLSFLAGIGGGIFSGFMPSTSYFFPKSKQGTALGIQAGVGNFGVSLIQFMVPWVIGLGFLGVASAQTFVVKDKNKVPTGATHDVWMQNAGLILIPLILIGIVLAWLLLKSVPIKANIRQQMDIFRNKHTWIMTAEYVLTFGVFSGLAGSFGLLLRQLFGDGAVGLAFLGALTGSVARVVWGPFCDKLGGGIWTVISGIGIAASTVVVIMSISGEPQQGLFLTGMLLVFFFAGVGNAATFKQMPMIFEARQAGGVIGWTAAIAAFGPFLFGVAFASFAKVGVFVFVGVYALICAALAWYYYARPNAEAKS